MKEPGASQGQSASELISKRTAELGDWRGETLGRMRKLIQEAVPDVVEEWKWMGTPVWSRDGIICTGESYKKVVKLTFARGASLEDPACLFNSSLEGKVRRAIDIHEGEKVDASAFKALVRQAVALNRSGNSKAPKKAIVALVNPATIDAYLAPLPAEKRAALQKLRAQIKAAAPGAEEYIGYGLAGFKLGGHPLLYFGAATHHCALYGALNAAPFAEKLKGFRQSKGTIQFTPDHPIPAALVKALVKARIEANRKRWGTKAGKAVRAARRPSGANTP